MATTASLTTTPTTIDSGASDNVSITNTGTVDVTVVRGSQSFTLRPTQGRVIYPEGAAVTAATVSGAGSVSYTATAARLSQQAQYAADPAFTGTYGAIQRPSTLPSSQTLAKTFRPDRSTYNVSPSSLKRARAAAAKAFAGTGRFDIACVGTSLTAGTGATTKVQSWPSKLQTALVSKGYADGGSGFIAAQSNMGTTTDARVTLGTGWSVFNAAISPAVQGTSTGGSLTFTDTKASTIIDVWYLDWFTFGFAWTIDGNAQTDVTPTNTGALRKVTVSGLSSATHTVVITPKTGTDGSHAVFIMGATFKNTTGVCVHNLGIGGMVAQEATRDPASSTNFQYRPRALAEAIAPQLTFYELGTNDGSPITSAYTTNLQAGITALTGLGSDVALISEPPAGVGTRDYAGIQALNYALADTNDLPLVDLYHRLISWSSLDALGLGYDTDSLTVHLSAAGYGDVARTITEGLAL